MVFIGMDNGRKAHCYGVVDESQNRVKKGVIPNESWAFTAWCEHIERCYPGQEIVVGIEAGGGMSSPFDQVMQERGWSVRQLLPEAVRTYRETVLRLHNKTDDTDAFAMARMLAANSAPYREVNQERAALRRATRWHQSLTASKTRCFNEMRAVLALYWPETTTSKVFAELDYLWTLTLLAHYPDPVAIVEQGAAGLRQLLREQGSTVPLKTVQAVVEVARSNTCFAEDKSFLVKQAGHLARLLLELNRAKVETDAAIARMSRGDADVEVLDAVYGVNTVQAATFMAEARSLDRFSNEAHMASYSGIALKRVQTGKSLDTQRRQWRANRRLKRCVMGIAETLILNEEKSKAYYPKKIAEKKTHLQALRALARQVIRRFFKLLKDNRHRLLQEALPQGLAAACHA